MEDIFLSGNVLSSNTMTYYFGYNASFLETRWGISYMKLQELGRSVFLEILKMIYI